ncbi:toll-like receptor 2 [Mya arenaria]|uniref:toll-like receptor 2 n=1 Tax=Mya arenaria TaxID=6604 RepID=UPI0022E4FC12|nr:toll-like receptor 2 [Mya arenaria]XP_052764423.1 toll-like receptor 2 [Mya arenaria]XP_052764424.1 toll-like receptor 2 [Mya arenaria]XP_052764425.1 toll-like receptor 2 [Mya arenaria]XP_052764426.1 toll-like receptor 2 [Mya arenaria]
MLNIAMGRSIYYSLITGIGLILCAQIPPCPGSSLCKCEKLSEDGLYDVYCNGNGKRQVINKEILPDKIRTLTVERFIFQKLSAKIFPQNIITVQRFHSIKNKIWDMNNDTFHNFESLSEVYFTDSTLQQQFQLMEAIGRSVKLTEIQLTRNNIDTFRPELLTNLDYLENVSVADNNICRFSGNITQLHPLKWLDMSNNRLDPVNIKFCFDNGSSLFPNLTILNVSRNFISSIQEDSWRCMKKLEILDLSNNNIQKINISSITHLVSLKHLILKKNWMNSMSGISPGMYPPHLEFLDLSDNQFSPFMPKLCDKFNNKTISIRRIDLSYNHISNLNGNFTKCLRNLTELFLSKNAIEILNTHSFAQFPNLSVLHIDRQNHGLSTIKKNAFEKNLKELNLKRNFITFTSENSKMIFSSCTGVTNLTLTDNVVMNKTALFSSLARLNLEVLVLKRVGLTEFPYELFTFKNLHNLVIDQNTIERIYFPPNTRELKSHVQYFSAEQNQIVFTENKTTLPEAVLKNLKAVNFGKNIYDCSCDKISRWFRSQIAEHGSQGYFQGIRLIGWPHNYLCHSPAKMIGKELADFHLTGEDCRESFMIVYIASACTGFVVFVMAVVSYWNRWYIQFHWHMFKKSCKRIRTIADPEREHLIEESGLLYDANVIYNENDSKFVLKDLRRLVEEKLHYKLLLRDRQGAVGGTKSDAYFDAMDASRNVIVVVSNNLIKDAWCEFQIDIALMNKIETRGKRKIFLVILTDVDLESVSKSWCVLLAKKNNGKWCETENSIRRKVFVEDLKATLGKPLSVEYSRSRSRADSDSSNHSVT